MGRVVHGLVQWVVEWFRRSSLSWFTNPHSPRAGRALFDRVTDLVGRRVPPGPSEEIAGTRDTYD